MSPYLESITVLPREAIVRFLTPSVQRIVDDSHVEQIVQNQVDAINRHGVFTLRQSLVVATVNNMEYIVDGQHRLEAFRRLLEIYPNHLDVGVPVLVYNLTSESELNELYRSVSQNKPIHPLEKSEEFVHLKLYLEYLTNSFHAYFSKSEKPLAPNMSEDKLKTKLNEIRPRLTDDASSLERATELLNKSLEHRLTTMQEKDHVRTYLDKTHAKRGRICYLTFFKNFEWVDLVLALLRETPSLDRAAANVFLGKIVLDKRRRTRIPATTRQNVWQKHNQMLNGSCYCCNNPLQFCNMVCGHIRAHALGGDSSLENLMPICAACNLAMGIENLEDYRARISK